MWKWLSLIARLVLLSNMLVRSGKCGLAVLLATDYVSFSMWKQPFVQSIIRSEITLEPLAT